ncbi:hypothetical protein HDU91_003203 [Kappamyces sp. JEL0680]|nr:hypothetical protein HDU91_003203 [Kappamyces sp. JEL0680]
MNLSFVGESLPKMVVLAQFKTLVPRLATSLRKGEAGIIAVVGGSLEYTGAPYFAAGAALRCGADLVHVYCHPQAATVIKSYSPELIVHPILQDSSLPDIEPCLEQFAQSLHRFDVLVVGPGLGRDLVTIRLASRIIEMARSQGKGLVIDADGLYAVQQNLDLIKGYQRCILTPNHYEYARLLKACQLDETATPGMLADVLGGVTVFQKQALDIISNGTATDVVSCHFPGSPRRIGGQGDILAGCLATFLTWALKHGQSTSQGQEAVHAGDATLLVGYAASRLVRQASFLAYQEHRRGMLTSHVLDQLGPAFSLLFEA